MIVTGPTLGLRAPEPADADALFAIACDPEVTRWFSWGPYASRAEPAAWIAAQPARRERGEALALAVVHPVDGVVGITELVEWSRRDRRAVVGTWLGRRWWGTGVNAASKELVLALAFGPCRLERVGAYADVANLRSQRALRRVGFSHEGTLRAWHRHGDVQKDVELYGLLRADWTPAAGTTIGGLHETALTPFIHR